MTEHYYTENPGSAIKERVFTVNIRGAALELTSVSGVFAFEEKIDKASRLLIENFLPSGNMVLDLGCGYGAIGLFLKSIYKNQQVCLTDINNRAVDYALQNARKNSLEVKVLQSDLFSALDGIIFDDIVSNPPIAAGKKLNFELIRQSHDHLRTRGALWLVAFHNKGGSTLKAFMEETFGNVEDREKSGGIRVYRSIR